MIELLFVFATIALVAYIIHRHFKMKKRIGNLPKNPPKSGQGWKPEELPTDPKPGDDIQPE